MDRQEKSLVGIVLEERGNEVGRIRVKRIADHTDCWFAYDRLPLKSAHEPIALRRRGKTSATELLPRIHLFPVLLKCWLIGTHRGFARPEYLY